MLSYKLWDVVIVNVIIIFTDIDVILVVVGGGSVYVCVSILCVVLFMSVILD